MRPLLAALVLSFLLADIVRAQGMLELFPQEAAASMAIRDLEDLRKKGDRFLEDSKIKVSLRPSQVFEFANSFLGLQQGLNRRGTAALVLLRPDKAKHFSPPDDDVLRLLVPIVPFSHADAMASNFGIGKGQLVAGKIRPTTRDRGSFSRYALRLQDHIYLSEGERNLQRILKSPSIAESFSPTHRKRLNECDMLLHIGRFVWQQGDNNIIRDVAAQFKPGDDPHEADFARQLVQSLDDIQHAVIGARLGEGIGLDFIATVPKESQASKLFRTLRGTRPACSLRGLPEGNVVLAQAISTDEKQHAFLARGLFNFLIEGLLVPGKVLAPVDRLSYLDLMHEVWRKLDGNRLAVYQNADESRLGLFSVVAILDTKDAEKFVKDTRTLMKMADAASLDLSRPDVKDEINIESLIKDLGSKVYATRLSASTRLALIGEPALPFIDRALKSPGLDLEASRRMQQLHARISSVAAERRKALLSKDDLPLFHRPALMFVPAIEKRAEVNVDAIQIKLAGLDKVLNHQYRQLLGPDWDKMRLGIVGNQIVVLIGSDVAAFEGAIKNLRTGQDGLAASKRLATFQQQTGKDRLFQFHVSLEGMLRLVTPNAPRGGEVSLTSLALSLDAESLQLEVWVPMAEARTIARKVQEAAP